MPLQVNNPDSGIVGEVEDNIIKYRFRSIPQGILVRAGQRLALGSWIAYNDGHNRCHYSETGDRLGDIINPDMGLFEVHDTPLSTNSTRNNRGICPGLLYRVD